MHAGSRIRDTSPTVIVLCFILVSAAFHLAANSFYTQHAGDRFFGTQRQSALYQDRRKLCVWKHVDAQVHNFGYTHFTHLEWKNESIASWMNGLEVMQPGMSFMRCQLQLGREERFVIDRVGPFVSSGGRDWHRWQWSDVGSASHELHPLAVTSASILALDLEGKIIPIPPIHAHHWHLSTPVGVYVTRTLSDSGAQAIAGSMVGKLIAQTHGDSQCLRSNEGTACYFQSGGTNEGYPLLKNFATVYGETNDIRTIGSPPLKHWLEVSITLTTRSVSRYWIEGFGNTNYAYQADFTYLKTGTHRVPASGPSIHWKERTFDDCQIASSIWWHTHHHMTRDMWFLQGSAREIGLAKFVLPSNGEALPLSDSIAGLQANLTHHMQVQPNVEILCRLAEAQYRFEYVHQDRSVDGTVEGWYARNIITCQDMIIRAAGTYTLVAFYEQTFDAHVSTTFVRQHNNIAWKATLCP